MLTGKGPNLDKEVRAALTGEMTLRLRSKAHIESGQAANKSLNS